MKVVEMIFQTVRPSACLGEICSIASNDRQIADAYNSEREETYVVEEEHPANALTPYVLDPVTVRLRDWVEDHETVSACLLAVHQTSHRLKRAAKIDSGVAAMRPETRPFDNLALMSVKVDYSHQM